MHKRFCFICGNQAIKEGLCEGCWSKRNKLAEFPDKIEFVQCPKCNLIQIRTKWVNPDFEKLIKDSTKISGETDAWSFTLQKNGYEVEVRGLKDGIRMVERHNIRLHAIKNICPVCGRLLSGYYEAIIQVRGEYNDSILEQLEKEARNIGKTDSMAFYRQEMVKGGADYFFGSKKAVKQIALSLKKKYGAELTESFQVVGRKDGKDLVRTIIAVRFAKK